MRLFGQTKTITVTQDNKPRKIYVNKNTYDKLELENCTFAIPKTLTENRDSSKADSTDTDHLPPPAPRRGEGTQTTLPSSTHTDEPHPQWLSPENYDRLKENGHIILKESAPPAAFVLDNLDKFFQNLDPGFYVFANEPTTERILDPTDQFAQFASIQHKYKGMKVLIPKVTFNSIEDGKVEEKEAHGLKFIVKYFVYNRK